jgi:hypothetical protein
LECCKKEEEKEGGARDVWFKKRSKEFTCKIKKYPPPIREEIF